MPGIQHDPPRGPAWFALAGLVVGAIAGAIAGLALGLIAYPLTAYAAVVELGLPGAAAGAILGWLVGLAVKARRSIAARNGSHRAR